MTIEDKIARWRTEPLGYETDEYTVLLCDAEVELRLLRYLATPKPKRRRRVIITRKGDRE